MERARDQPTVFADENVREGHCQDAAVAKRQIAIGVEPVGHVDAVEDAQRRVLGIAGAKTDAGDIAADQRYGVGAEIPEGEILGCAAKDLFKS